MVLVPEGITDWDAENPGAVPLISSTHSHPTDSNEPPLSGWIFGSRLVYQDATATPPDQAIMNETYWKSTVGMNQATKNAWQFPAKVFIVDTRSAFEMHGKVLVHFYNLIQLINIVL